jgi:hypothetical protein
MNRLLPALALLFLVFVSADVVAALGVEVTIRSAPIPERVKDLKMDKPPAPSASEERVADLDGGTYAEYSLYADAGFRSSEILNREALARAMQAAKLPKTPQSLVLAEHELSVVHPRQPGKVERKEAADRVQFFGEGLSLFEISTDGSLLSSADAKSLARYMRYFRGGHPAALAELERRSVMPSRIEMASGPFQSSRTTIVLNVMAVESAPSASLDGTRKVASADLALPKELAAAAWRIGEARRDDIERAARETYARAEALLASGKLTAGFLGALEYGLQSGVGVSDLLMRNRDAFKASAELQQVFPYLGNPRNREELNRAIEGLRASRTSAGDMAYVLGLFEANHHLALNNPKAAGALFVEALRRNTHMAGAWKDLGDAMFRQWRMSEAWLCWDTGRKLAPGFKNFEPVNRFEEKLTRDLSEYF